MRIIYKHALLVLSAESDAERAEFQIWSEAATGRVFHFKGQSPGGGVFFDLGPLEVACREPINIVYDGDERWRPISNLAETPFTLHKRHYASVEGFWQGLKFPSDNERRKIAKLSGLEARRAGQETTQPDRFDYEGKTFAAGAFEHRNLMTQACEAKFAQNLLARETLLATGERPLTHRVRRDSKTIPGALMADIWMRIRARLRNAEV